MKNRLRCFWLWFLNEVEFRRSQCYYCGAWGAAVCSLVYPKRLCNVCATAVCRSYVWKKVKEER